MSHMRRPEPGPVVAATPKRKRTPVFPPATVEHRRPILPDPHADEAERIGAEGRTQRMRMLAGVIVARELAAKKAEVAAGQRAQLRRVGAEEAWASASDRGAQGPAMLARGAKVEDVLVDVRDEADDSLTQLERVSVVRVRDGVVDHYERAGILWGRRLDAVVMLADLYQASRIAPGTGRSGGGRGHGTLNEGQARAWADYCRATDHLSPGVRAVVEDVARGLFPAWADAAPKLRDGAWQLADHFRLSVDKVG